MELNKSTTYGLDKEEKQMIVPSLKNDEFWQKKEDQITEYKIVKATELTLLNRRIAFLYLVQ